MTKDIAITDTCYYFEYGPAHFWENPDVSLPSGLAHTGSDNTVLVNLRRKGGAGSPLCNDTIDNGTAAFYVIDLFVAVPNANINVNDVTVVKKILHQPTAAGAAAIPIELGKTVGAFPALPAPGAAVPYSINWRIPATSPTSHAAEAAGHKCLVARVYENSAMPNNSLPLMELAADDPHYAQRNICINMCSPCGVDLVTSNATNETPRQFQLRVVHNPNPSRFLLETIAIELRQSDQELGRIAKEPPSAGFGLRVADMPNIRWLRNQPTREIEVPSVDLSGCRNMILQVVEQLLRASNRNQQPLPRLDTAVRAQVARQRPTLPTVALPNSVEGAITLAPGQRSNYSFETDLHGEAPGSTHIFHVMEIESGIVQGGVTIVMIKS